MIDVLTSVLAFLFAICVLVAVHEWGHYIVARLCGVKVLRFSIGFGRPLWLRRAGPDQTEYCLSAIPIGGYVRLLDERDGSVAPQEVERSFNRRPFWHRVAILFAGPGLNFVFAVLAYWLIFVLGVPGMKPVVGTVEPDSVAAEAGILEGDEVTAVGGRPVATWEGAVLAMLDELLAAGDIGLAVVGSDGQERRVTLATSGSESALTEPGQLFSGIGFSTWSPILEPVIDEVLANGTAASAGLRSGDRILAVGSQEFSRWSDWKEFVQARPGETVDVVVLREGVRIRLPLAIGKVENEGGTIGQIGATARAPLELFASMRSVQRYPGLQAFGEALGKTWDMTALTVRMLVRMVTGDVSVKNISGPINIAQFAGYTASSGLVSFVSFLAIVSISLGILNLLPVPMLDGGQIVYQVVEALKGSPLSDRSLIIGQQMGILFLLVLMTFAFYNDLSRLLG